MDQVDREQSKPGKGSKASPTVALLTTETDGQTAARRRRDVRTARDKLGEQFDELRAVLPKRGEMELTAKSQILESALFVLRELMTRATTLAVELAVVSPEATHSWVQDVSDDGRRPIEHTIVAILKLFCWSRRWHYAELWTLDEKIRNEESNHLDHPVEAPYNGQQDEGDSAITSDDTVGRANGGPDNVQACVIRDSVSVMRLARTVINMKGAGRSGEAAAKDLATFASISKTYQFRPRIGMPGRVWSSRRAEWLAGLGDKESYRRATLAQEFGMKSCLAVPVLLGGQVHSVMAFYSSQTRPFNSQCHDLATTLAESLAQIYSPQTASGWESLSFRTCL